MIDSRLRRMRDQPSGPATLINKGCNITGTLAGTGDFLINGEVNGDCDLAGTVTLAKDGIWRGMIKARNVIVAGRAEGDILASDRVEVTDTARITGTITGGAIAVAEGAVVEGVMKTTAQEEPTAFVEKRGRHD